ncbi:FadR family transcriptional regulator [Ancylobacter sp. MQZ15Z-1]|uniref:FadR family transcriptional regulator n=1 Tax=Ancylobacter mangrovi TaxID=2972472 RepID=A0A9X2P9Y0_9HYPH|nr:FadR/GntR family transcriptional regulator [Ancylobacter mangrovi]MCS0494789.1 FadR family transcriptional regulator [Ancylobacter mangrovi]
MPIEIEPVVTTGVAKQIAENIRSAIMDGRLKSDERLPTESELAEQYGVSRPTIREALKRLAAQNLIRSRRGPAGGNFVARPQPDDLAEGLSSAVRLMVGVGAFDLDEIARTRMEMEAICCRLAADNRTDEHLARMRAELEVQRSHETSDVDFCASDVRFHRALVDAAGNRLLGFLMVTLIEALLPVSNLIAFLIPEREQIIAFHRAILAGLEAHDAEAAVEASNALIAYLRDRHERAIAVPRTRHAVQQAKS